MMQPPNLRDEEPAASNRRRWIVVGMLAVLLVGWYLFEGRGNDVATTFSEISSGLDSGESSRPADRYVDEYGGERTVYARILGSSDCQFLQGQFDIAADNNDLATPGSDEHKWTLGYMTAADEQLEASGCY